MLERLSTARNRELVNLLFLAVLTVCGFTAVLVARSGAISSTSLIDAAAFLALFAIAHVALRWRLPQADPYLLPLVGILAVARALRDLPDPPRARPRPGALDRDRRRRVRRDPGAAARLPRARALPLPVRRGRARAARDHDRVLVRDAHRDQRRARLDPRRRTLVPAGRAREDLPGAVPGRLPARAARAAGADADAHPRHRPAAAPPARAAARDARRRARPARRDERLRHVAAVLRRLRRARVRRHRAHRVRRDRARRVRRRQRHRVPDRAAGGRARDDLARPVEDAAHVGLPARAVALHRRRTAGCSARVSAAATSSPAAARP